MIRKYTRRYTNMFIYMVLLIDLILCIYSVYLCGRFQSNSKVSLKGCIEDFLIS